jgi:DNA-binding NarL/FixJ family response regulator
LRLLAPSYTNPQIGDALDISRKTASHHVSSVLTKLDMTTGSRPERAFWRSDKMRHASEREARCAVGFGRSERVDAFGRYAVQVPRRRTG